MSKSVTLMKTRCSPEIPRFPLFLPLATSSHTGSEVRRQNVLEVCTASEVTEPPAVPCSVPLREDPGLLSPGAAAQPPQPDSL